MSGWKQRTLAQVIQLIGGGTPKTSVNEYWDNGTIPWLSVNDFSGDRKYVYDAEKNITELGLINSSTKLLCKDDIIVSARGTVGEIAILKNEMAFNQSCYGIRGTVEIYSNSFLYYLLKYHLNDLKSNAYGAVFDTITRETFSHVSTILPPLPEQKAIAEVLGSLDDKIELLHQQNKTLEDICITIYKKYFLPEDRVRNENITDLIDFNPRLSLPKGMLAPYLEMSSLSTETFNPTSWYMREFNGGAKFQNGDSLLARITPCLENGKASHVTFLGNDQTGWGSTEYIVFRSKESLHPLTGYLLIRSKEFKEYAEGCLEGSSGRQRVNEEHLKEFAISIPSSSEINEYNNLLTSIYPRLQNNAREIIDLTKIRETLLPKLMSGEASVL